MRVSEMKDPVIVWDGSRGAYWRTDGNGYCGSAEVAGVWERADAPKDSERKFEYFILPPDHIQVIKEALEKALKRITELEADAERLNAIEAHKHKYGCWEISTDSTPIIWLSSSLRSSDPAQAKRTLRQVIDEFIAAQRQKEGKK